MRIGFLSYEYPIETGGGGIGTYLQTMTWLLQQKGHSVVVFSGTKNAKPFWENDFVYRIPSENWAELNEVLTDYFLPIHKNDPFDVIECTDFQGCGLSLKRTLPHLPTVVRLHTPLFLIDKLMYRPLSFFQKLRFVLGSFKRFQPVSLPLSPQAKNYRHEFEIIELADVVSSPSQSITNEMKVLGFGLNNKTEIVPLPFDITEEFSSIQARTDMQEAPEIIYIGRLEVRKGVIDLADAIPQVLKHFPRAHFSFIGDAALSPKHGVDMQTYLKERLKGYETSVSFTGKISRKEVMTYLAKGDIFIFPSHYESFGLACCEAMASGKAVIGSKNGGMAEIIEDGKSGVLVEPKQPNVICKTLVDLIDNNEFRLELGKMARLRIQNYLSTSVIMEKQITSYRAAIAKSRTTNLTRAVDTA